MPTIKPIPDGYERKWVKCKECGRVAYYDFVPYSLNNPIMSLPCKHDVGQKFNDCVEEITMQEAFFLILEERGEDGIPHAYEARAKSDAVLKQKRDKAQKVGEDRGVLLVEDFKRQLEKFIPAAIDDGRKRVDLCCSHSDHFAPKPVASTAFQEFVRELEEQGYEVIHTKPEDFKTFISGYTSDPNFFRVSWE